MYWSPAHPFLLNYLLAYLGTCMGTWPAEQTTNFSTEPAHEPAPRLVHPRHFDPGAGPGGMQRGRLHLYRTLYVVPPGCRGACSHRGDGRELTNSSPFPPQESGIRPGVSPSPVQEACVKSHRKHSDNQLCEPRRRWATRRGSGRRSPR